MTLRYIDNLVDNGEDAIYLINMLRGGSYRITLDTETNGLDPYVASVLLVQIGFDDEIFVLNRGKVGKQFFVNLLNLINEVGAVCVGHNIKFDVKALAVDTGVMLTKVYDTMVVESVLTAGVGEKAYSLQALVLKYCGVELVKDTRLQFAALSHDSIFTEQQITYSANDLVHLFTIMDIQQENATEEKLINTVNLEMELLPVVAKMELTGITLDVEHWKGLMEVAEKRLGEIAVEIRHEIFEAIDKGKYQSAYDFATALAIPVKTKRLRTALEAIVEPTAAIEWISTNLNLGSHKQLLTALNLAGVDTPNTNEKTLSKLPKNVIVDKILEYRDYEKRLSTYGQNVIDLICPVTGKVHTDYFQVGTVTGRFSSTNPNLQNMPTHNGYREGFVAREGYSFMAMDYSQQEYRLAGALSKEPAIIEAYLSGFDMHTASAAKRYNKELKDVTKDERSKGKGINFTVLYGGTEWALGKNLSVPTDEAKGILSKFFADYPKLTAFKNAVEEKIIELGYSITPMGRKRYFKPLPAMCTPNEVMSTIAKNKREGFNMVIQGGGADVTKLSMINIDKHNPFGDKYCLLLQVHDELLAEVHDSILKEAEAFMRYEMTSAFQPLLGEIPAVVDCKISKRWTKG